MTDFLTRLAERTLGLATIIQPMIAPMYAPEQHWDEYDLLEATEEVSTMESKLAACSLPAMEVLPIEEQAPGGRDALRSHFAEAQINTPAHLTTPVPHVDTQPQTQRRDSIQHIHEFINGQPPATIDDSSLPRSAAMNHDTTPFSSPSQENLSGEKEKRFLGTLAPLVDELQYGQPLAHGGSAGQWESAERRKSEGQQGSAEWVPERKGSEGRPQGSPLHVSSQGGVDRLREKTAFVGTSRKRAVVGGTDMPALETTAPTPTIQVTIGRIEVRATPSPTTTARSQQQRSTPPVMSLDEYLHQRSKGGH
jgi:hypothetical protein